MFLLAAKNSRNESLYALALTTGMRQSELLGLQWADLDWTNKTLKVQRQLERKRGSGLNFSPLKTKAAKRTITLGNKSMENLRAHFERQEQERKGLGEKWQENDLIFPARYYPRYV